MSENTAFQTTEDCIDDIRNTLLEGFDQTNDINGPNWEYMARFVYEQHLVPVLKRLVGTSISLDAAESRLRFLEGDHDS